MRRVILQAWRASRPQIVTVAAMTLVCIAVFMVWVPAGLVVSGLCFVVLERKVELDRR